MPDNLQIRNFCIIAHIDHGKSTLADRLLERTGAITQREMESQFLDDMDLERERGITIKASAVSVFYTHPDTGQKYIYNLIDTPGHVDFHYEVAKALQACEGALLLCDATQGVQAQTVANAYAAIEQNLEIIPVINKIDLPSARPDEVAEEMEQVLGIDALDVRPHLRQDRPRRRRPPQSSSPKNSPPPKGDSDAPLQCLIFDSKYDDYRGVIVYVRVINGTLTVGQKIRMIGADKVFIITDLGKFMPKATRVPHIGAGEVGFIVANIKTIQDVTIGDTVADATEPRRTTRRLSPAQSKWSSATSTPAPTPSTPSSATPSKNSASTTAASPSNPKPPTPSASASAAASSASSTWRSSRNASNANTKSKSSRPPPPSPTKSSCPTAPIKTIDSASELPDPSKYKAIREPMIKANIIVPAKNIGDVTQLCIDRRGLYKKTEFINADRVILEYEIPLAEVIFDFFDRLKTVTQGYGTLDYDLIGFKEDDLVKMDILVAGDKIAALSLIVHRSKADQRGRAIIKKLKARNRPPPFRSRPASRHRQPRHRPRNHLRPPQRRHQQMLRRRHQPQTQAARKAKRRQKAHETSRPRRNPARSLHVHPGIR